MLNYGCAGFQVSMFPVIARPWGAGTMRDVFKRILLAVVTAVLLCLSADAAGFEAYYTRLDQSLKGDAGKYSDLVVVLGPTGRIEFARADGYLPRWRTAGGVHPVEDLFPEGD